LGITFFVARKYEQAIEQEKKTLELDPNYSPAERTLGMTYGQKSLHKEAIAEVERALAISPGNINVLSELGYIYAIAGRQTDAQRMLDQLNDLSKPRYVPAGLRALIYVGLDKDKAFEWLEKGYEERLVAGDGTNDIKVDPVFDDEREWIKFQRSFLLRDGFFEPPRIP
jgi:tetratricopeptide (TPR) repeat protein